MPCDKKRPKSRTLTSINHLFLLSQDTATFYTLTGMNSKTLTIKVICYRKLMSEIFCQQYRAECGMKTAFARFHNVHGPDGTWGGGREKAPAPICRKVITAQESDKYEIII